MRTVVGGGRDTHDGHENSPILVFFSNLLGSMGGEFPTAGMELTRLLVVQDVARSTTSYRDVLGATVVREYGGTSVVLQFLGTEGRGF